MALRLRHTGDECGLRDYGVEGQLGSEPTPEEYLATMVDVFRGVRRVLRDDGTLWLNMGDSYCAAPKGSMAGQDKSGLTSTQTQEHSPMGVDKRAPGLKPKDLCGIPWRLALALQADGWWLRSDIIWAKPNPMPESCTDRPTKSHEYLFLLTKRPTYYWDAEAVKETGRYPAGTVKRGLGSSKDFDSKKQATLPRGERVLDGNRNIRSVWNIPTQSFPDAHFATFPEKLILPCIRAGTSAKGCCPECGAGWARVVERDRRPTRPGKNWKGAHPDSPLNEHTAGYLNVDPHRHVTETTTTGWLPGCKCVLKQLSDVGEMAERFPAIPGDRTTQLGDFVTHWDVRPCTVLDPFAGSGTVGVVCARENRAFVGIELNPKYAKMAEERIVPAMRVADDDRRQATFEYEESPQ